MISIFYIRWSWYISVLHIHIYSDSIVAIVAVRMVNVFLYVVNAQLVCTKNNCSALSFTVVLYSVLALGISEIKIICTIIMSELCCCPIWFYLNHKWSIYLIYLMFAKQRTLHNISLSPDILIFTTYTTHSASVSSYATY